MWWCDRWYFFCLLSLSLSLSLLQYFQEKQDSSSTSSQLRTELQVGRDSMSMRCQLYIVSFTILNHLKKKTVSLTSVSFSPSSGIIRLQQWSVYSRNWQKVCPSQTPAHTQTHTLPPKWPWNTLGLRKNICCMSKQCGPQPVSRTNQTVHACAHDRALHSACLQPQTEWREWNYTPCPRAREVSSSGGKLWLHWWMWSCVSVLLTQIQQQLNSLVENTEVFQTCRDTHFCFHVLLPEVNSRILWLLGNYSSAHF